MKPIRTCVSLSSAAHKFSIVARGARPPRMTSQHFAINSNSIKVHGDVFALDIAEERQPRLHDKAFTALPKERQH